MKRAMSRRGGAYELVEHAAMPSPTGMLGDDEIRERARNAPPHIKQSIDERRIARGMRSLWSTAERRSAMRPRPPATPTSHVMLFGCIAPGTSVPVMAATDGLLLRERFEPDAFRASLKLITEDRVHIELLDGHDGPALASTLDGSLLLTAGKATGVAIEARVENTGANAGLLAEAFSGTLGLSVAFRPRRMEIIGKRHRVVHEASITHVALVRPCHGKPAYATRVRAIYGTSAAHAAIGRSRAFIDAMRVILRQESGD
jgi:hypothetical protein